ncbi:MAG: sodium:proton antiporter [Deltaproteobacteria bacterium]|nr:sodium:proton antiporter [Deltaproteobacteria bacterium]
MIPSLPTMLPFAGILLSIALFPLLAHRFWEHHYGKVSAFWGLAALALMAALLPTGVSFSEVYGHRLVSTAEEYLSFIVLLGTLFVITGGIHVSGRHVGSPLHNTELLGVGALLASLIGTTGAAMLLIRPLLRANHHRPRQVHVYVFYIFLVCNTGGLLTPIGDPPLFLGFLQGIPFAWTLQLFPEWLFVNGALLVLFFLWDRRLYALEPSQDREPPGRLTVKGWVNFPLLMAVVAAVILSGGWPEPWGGFARDGILLALAGLSLWVTPSYIHHANQFNFAPIREVAILFAGIFTAMVPALMVLNARGGELGLSTPAEYFWAAGTLSSFLDNAPTYLAFLSAAMGALGLTHAVEMTLTPGPAGILAGISVGAVYMGAMTYIGNGPNFMVKTMVEQSRVSMPSFFGYMAYSVGILLPLFLLLTLLFF